MRSAENTDKDDDDEEEGGNGFELDIFKKRFTRCLNRVLMTCVDDFFYLKIY
jgi:hypothetical protein